MGPLDRHFEGWQLAVAAVGMALLAAILALPRTVPPREIPLPAVDREEQRETRRVEQARIERVQHEPLPFAVRAVGEALRRFGAAEASGDRREADALAVSLSSRAADARKRHGDEPLLALRSIQTSLFVRSVREFERTGEVPRELSELGGAFARLGVTYGWISRDRSGALPDDALETLFAVRWTRLVGWLDSFPFSPTLNDWRCYFRTLMSHPEIHGGETDARTAATLSTYVKALAHRDMEYPELLAQGILENRMGHFLEAEELLAAHLRQNPSGPWRLRAQNYLLAARAHAR